MHEMSHSMGMKCLIFLNRKLQKYHFCTILKYFHRANQKLMCSLQKGVVSFELNFKSI